MLFPRRRPAEGKEVGAGVAALRPLHGIRYEARSHRLPEQAEGAGAAATAPHHRQPGAKGAVSVSGRGA